MNRRCKTIIEHKLNSYLINLWSIHVTRHKCTPDQISRTIIAIYSIKIVNYRYYELIHRLNGIL